VKDLNRCLQDRGMANKQACERVLNITNYQWNADLNHNEILIPVLGIFAPNQIENLMSTKKHVQECL